MRIASFTALALTTLLTTLTAGCADVQTGVSAADVASASKGTEPLHTFTSDVSAFDTHSFWLDTGREVVVFDAQFTPAIANDLIAEIHAKTASPIRWVVVTHPNPDKFNGAPAFQAIGAKVVASASTARAIPGVHAYKKAYFVDVARTFTAQTYPAEATIDLTFSGDYELPLAGTTKVTLHELAHRGVSSTQTVAIVPRLAAVVVGDLVHHRAHAWLEGGIVDGRPTPDIAAWKDALDELAAYPGTTVYGGRGATAKVETAIADQKAYLDRMTSIIGADVRTVGAAELTGPNAGTHSRKLAALATEAFPDHAFPYMIEYGSYGLAQQLAR